MEGALEIWISIAVICLIIDFLTSGFLFVWFTIGSIGAIIALSLGYPFAVQIGIFIVLTGISYSIGYPLAKKVLNKSIPRTITMEENFIGRVIIAENDIKEKARIKIGGIYWTVKNQGEYILKNEKFKIVGIEGNKLIIRKEGDEVK